MDVTPVYRITEEIVRQAIEVAFLRDARWLVAFSNPAGGAWKMITLGDYIGMDLRYLKEEDRPDLILFNEELRLFLVLEAKDNISALLATKRTAAGPVYEQLEKSVEVFAKEVRRLDTILGSAAFAAQVFRTHGVGHYTVVCGYVYGGVPARHAAYQAELHRLHRIFAAPKADVRILPALDFIVTQQQPSLDLVTRVTVTGVDAPHLELLRRALPPDLAATLTQV